MKTAIKTKFNLYNIRNSLAFTLAEVLITLGIIGIVAAMTIPTLINNSKKQETVTKLQKIYSTLQQAVKMSEIENGSLETWDFALSNKDFMNTYIVPYLAVIKNCGTTESGCWSNDLVIKRKNNLADTENISSFTRILLKDGTFIALVNQGAHAHFYADLDGLKGSNIYGRDVFIFTLTPVALYEASNHDIKTAGLYLFGHGFDRAHLLYTCNTGAGNHCGGLIQLDGWKISDDYKW